VRHLDDTRWARVARGAGRGLGDHLAAGGLRFLSLLYGAALRLHHAGYRLGLARRTRLPALTVGIGNLTVGGTGKTTAAIATARWLARRGHAVAVLSRGYGGAAEKTPAVVSKGLGPVIGPDQAGDEPYLIARALPGVFVLAGADRRRTGRLAVDDLGADALVLDDAFQYQRLVKDLEIVLVDALAPFGYDFLVPRGLLREPPDQLARAGAVWLTHTDLVRDRDLRAVDERVRQLAPAARIWWARHAALRLRRLDAEGEWEPEALGGRRVFALSSIGSPAAFERTLEKHGAVLVGRARFPDHHRFSQRDLRGLLHAGAEAAEWLVTTEKDAVRLPAQALARPTWALEVELAPHESAPPLSEELTCLLEGTGETTG
jgi:tetraacyldisaccharide 4'-kinase